MGAALRVGGIVLAAGRGRRFGSDKREARLSDGTGMLERSAGLLAAVCDELLVVIGEDDHEQDYRGRFGAARVLLLGPRACRGSVFARCPTDCSTVQLMAAAIGTASATRLPVSDVPACT